MSLLFNSDDSSLTPTVGLGRKSKHGSYEFPLSSFDSESDAPTLLAPMSPSINGLTSAVSSSASMISNPSASLLNLSFDDVWSPSTSAPTEFGTLFSNSFLPDFIPPSASDPFPSSSSSVSSQSHSPIAGFLNSSTHNSSASHSSGSVSSNSSLRHDSDNDGDDDVESGQLNRHQNKVSKSSSNGNKRSKVSVSKSSSSSSSSATSANQAITHSPSVFPESLHSASSSSSLTEADLAGLSPQEVAKLRNREAATRYRNKKRHQHEELESQMDALQSELQSNRSSLVSLATENQMLKAQLNFFKDLLKLSMPNFQLPPNMFTSPSGPLSSKAGTSLFGVACLTMCVFAALMVDSPQLGSSTGASSAEMVASSAASLNMNSAASIASDSSANSITSDFSAQHDLSSSTSHAGRVLLSVDDIPSAASSAHFVSSIYSLFSSILWLVNFPRHLFTLASLPLYFAPKSIVIMACVVLSIWLLKWGDFLTFGNSQSQSKTSNNLSKSIKARV